MIFIRSLIFFLAMLLITPVYAVACLIVFPVVNASTRYEFVKGWNITITYLAKVICKIEYEIIGLENMKAVLDQPAIILSKHQSAWETISFIALFPKQLCFVLILIMPNVCVQHLQGTMLIW